MENFELFYKHFKEFLEAFGQKNSDIKEQILYVLFTSNSHLSAQEISSEIYKIYKNEISMTSIYLFLNFLETHHLANSFEENGVKKFELNLKSSHDHLICEICGKIVDFEDEMIEKRQEQICKEKNFKEKSHTMMLYGICSDCQAKNRD
ncbi:Fur family transcriptional regulator [Campylobacter sp.]|uniref:Fur family transcriptional regulator n=1 Tax=Campylobacter sp. TaxID=205 RepID=UPI003FA04A41